MASSLLAGRAAAAEVGEDGVPRRKRDGVRVVEVPVAHGFSIWSAPEMLRTGAAPPPAAVKQPMVCSTDPCMLHESADSPLCICLASADACAQQLSASLWRADFKSKDVLTHRLQERFDVEHAFAYVPGGLTRSRCAARGR